MLLACWQLAVTVFRVREYLLPSPLAVLRATLDFRIPWWTHLGITSLEIAGAFVVAGAVGIALGVAIAWSPTIAAALLPFLVFVTVVIPRLADRVVVMTPRPGRVAQVFDVPMPRPRAVVARASIEFGRRCLAMYEALHARGPVPLS